MHKVANNRLKMLTRQLSSTRSSSVSTRSLINESVKEVSMMQQPRFSHTEICQSPITFTEGVGLKTFTLNRPSALNALNQEMMILIKNRIRVGQPLYMSIRLIRSPRNGMLTLRLVSSFPRASVKLSVRVETSSVSMSSSPCIHAQTIQLSLSTPARKMHLTSSRTNLNSIMSYLYSRSHTSH